MDYETEQGAPDTTGDEKVEDNIGEDEELIPVTGGIDPNHDETAKGSDFRVYISWKDLRFEVPHPTEKGEIKTILHDLNGHVKPGEICAVIGPSGSGKTSFLNAVAGRLSEGVTGRVLFNNVTRPHNFSRFTGYVVQEDLYFDVLTVRETLNYAAEVKLPLSMTWPEKMERVERLIEELDLVKCQDTRVGKIGEGISGGERRRLAMALELIDEPAVLLLDEPTSGLDSASALMIGNILKRLATEKQITIVATIHQPRISLAKMFDKIYFLAKGKELYFGPAFPNVVAHFQDAGHPIPVFENPMDFLLDLVNTQDAENVEVAHTRDEIIEHVHKFYMKSEYCTSYALDYSIPDRFAASKIFSKTDTNPYITPFYNQIWVLFRRAIVNNIREPISLATQTFNSILMPLIFGSIYWQMDLSFQSQYDRFAAISLQVLMTSFFAFDVLLLLPKERKMFLREHASGMYRSFSFYMGRSSAELPAQVILVIASAAIAYWMYGLQNNVDKFITYCLLCFLIAQTGASCFLAIGAISPALEASNILATVILLVFMLFDGNWISLDKIPAGWSWVRHLSFMGLAGNAAIASEYRGITFTCQQSDINAGTQCVLGSTLSGETILRERGLGNVNVGFNMIVLVIHIVAWRTLGFIAWVFLYRYESPMFLLKQCFGCGKEMKEDE